MKLHYALLFLSLLSSVLVADSASTPIPTLALAPSASIGVYDARIEGREILTPAAPAIPRITGADIFGVRPGKPILFRVSATGEKPLAFSAKGLPVGVMIDSETGWITGRAPQAAGDVTIEVDARNAKGNAARTLTLRVGEEICLTPPMGWNSWYVQSEGVSDKAIRETATALQEKGLTDHGWTYLNIDDCWMGLRDQETKAIQPNSKFPDMKALVQFVNSQGLKVGLYSTPWMSTYAGYIGGSSPNEMGDYSAFFLPENERQNPHQVFGRYPGGIRRGLGTIGPVWFVDRDARQFAEWGIDYVKYDWKEWTLTNGKKGFEADKSKPVHKTEAVTKRLHDDFRALDRDIVISLSPDHDAFEDGFVPRYCNLWRLTPDIHADWGRIVAPFGMEERLRQTGPGHYGDLDMLQIGPLGKPNRAEIVFKPSPLKPAEQYFQVTLWAILTQPLLLSCHIPTMDAFDLNLVTNDEVLAVNQDRLCKQAYRVASRAGVWEIWVKDLADGGKAVALFNLSDNDQTIELTAQQLGITGKIRDLWRQKNIGELNDHAAVKVTSHGAAFFKILPAASGEIRHEIINVKAPFAMPAIRVPIFPARDFSITDFGAQSSRDFDNTDAIRKAIAACHDAGGGRVVIPSGEWFTGAIHLKSNVNLHLAKDAVLSFSDNPKDYLPAVQSSWEGWECFNYSPLIYAFQCENVAITGSGKIAPRMDNWKKWFARPPAHMDALKRLYTMGSTGVPVEKRQMAEGDNNLRPQLIQFNRCKNVLIEDVQIRNSPFWTIHLLLCESVVVRRVDISAHGHNNDGIDPEGTRNLLIEDCIFDQGDDAIAIKSGTNHDGWRLNTPSENIVMRNCVIKNGHQIVAIGSELSGGVRNVYVHDIRYEPTNSKTTPFNALYIKTNRRRGGFVENITMENIDATSAQFRMGVFGIETDVLYQWRTLVPAYEERLTPIRNIAVRNIKAKETTTPFRILGDKDQPVKNVVIENITIDTVRGQKNRYEHVENVTEKNITIGTFVESADKDNPNK